MRRVLTCALAALAGCTVDHVLIAPRDLGPDEGTPRDYPFCPTKIDVYGGDNVLLAGCGGPTSAPGAIAGGFFAPGTSTFDATLAGRLQSRLAADADLAAAFGTGFRVRSCATTAETMATLAVPLDEDRCGVPDQPGAMGQHAAACTDAPAPVVLLLGSGEDDGCHGGSLASVHADDKTGFANHYAARVESFLAARRPRLALVAPPTEWYQDPGVVIPGDGGVPTEACQWKRGDWDESGVRRYEALHPADATLYVFGHLHEESKARHPCCRALGATCAASWFTSGPRGPTLLNCDGAQALLDFWYARLKKTLLANRFQCP